MTERQNRFIVVNIWHRATHIHIYTYTYTHMKQAETEQHKAPAELQGQELTTNLYRQFVAYIDAAPETIRAYAGNLRQFIRYLADNKINRPTRETIMAYRDELKKRCKATTVQNYIEAIRIFFNWTAQAGLYPNIADHVKGAKISREHKKDFLTSRQAAAVLESIDRGTLQGLRDYAIIALVITGGLRVIEAHRANIEDLSKSGAAPVLYIQGKGAEDRAEYIKLPPEVETALKAYIKRRNAAEPKQPLFASISNNSNGQRLSKRSISGIIKQRLINAGYNSERLTAHSLRHSAVTIALLEGKSLQEVQQFARHKNITTTQIYAHNLDRAKNNCEETIASSIFTNAERQGDKWK